MADIHDIRDLQVIKYAARDEELSTREYMHKLRLHSIPLETAIGFAREGTTIREYVRERTELRRLEEERIRLEARRHKRFVTVVRAGAAAVVIGLAALILTSEPQHPFSAETLPTLADYSEDYMGAALIMGP
tara:strand:+ start:501 stop:896 length:396 start_codon:yes stop_codon:yes gene_type:complete